MSTHLCLLLGLLLAALPLPPDARAGCVVNARATIPLQVIGGTIIVPVQVNGRDASFILDTGAQRSVVTQDATQRLGLARDEWIGTTMSGVGGNERRANADPRTLSLGGVPLVRRTVSHDTSLVVGTLPRARAGDLVVDGLLGRDFLSLFDLDLDLPSHQVTVYQVHDCAGRFPAENALVVPVKLDGVPLRALLDTGSGASLLAATGIVRLGLQSASLANDPADRVTGLGPRVVTMRRHTFRSLQVGDQVMGSPAIWVAPVRLAPIVDMLLGADWLASRRLWISYTTQQLFAASP